MLREHGHNEDEDQANEDPGVNSDNEEDDEFKVEANFKSSFMQSAIESDPSQYS